MQDYMEDSDQRKRAEAACAERLVRWQGEDAIELVRELNIIAARAYFSKWRQ